MGGFCCCCPYAPLILLSTLCTLPLYESMAISYVAYKIIFLIVLCCIDLVVFASLQIILNCEYIEIYMLQKFHRKCNWKINLFFGAKKFEIHTYFSKENLFLFPPGMASSHTQIYQKTWVFARDSTEMLPVSSDKEWDHLLIGQYPGSLTGCYPWPADWYQFLSLSPWMSPRVAFNPYL